MRAMRKVAGSVMIVALLAGCSGNDDDSTPAPDGEATSDSFVDVTDQQGTLEGFVGASDDVEITTCENDGDVLKVAGEATNPESSAQQYRIYVSAREGGNTVGLVQVDIPSVDPGSSQEWETTMPFDQDDLDCILRVERATP